MVIIGFGAFNVDHKRIYDYEHGSERATEIEVQNISPYLLDGPDLALPIRRAPLCDVPDIVNGNKPADGGFLIVEDNDRASFLQDNPAAADYIKPFVSAEEYLNGRNRWVLWLLNAPPQIFRDSPGLRQRVEGVRAFRAASRKESTRRGAEYPTLFDQIRQPTSEYILIPRHSSERRKYVPFGYFGPEVIIGDSCTAIPDATLYHFGVVSSVMHMAWMRTVCGRLKSDFRYSNKLVYNNFPWPQSPDLRRVGLVEVASNSIIELRKHYLPPNGDSTLADLYDPLTMPAPLVKAHADLDRSVDRCYQSHPFKSDRERVELLFCLYEQLSSPLLPASKTKRGRNLEIKRLIGSDEIKSIFSSSRQNGPRLQANKIRITTATEILRIPKWYHKVCRTIEQGFEDDGMDEMYAVLGGYIESGDFETCDRDIAVISNNASRSPVSALIGILTITRDSSERLPSRLALRKATEARLRALDMDAAVVLRGL